MYEDGADIATKIADMQEGEQYTFYAAILERQMRDGMRGPFMTMALRDSSGDIDAVLFNNCTDETAAQFPAGSVVLVTGRRGSYQGRPQIVIDYVDVAADGTYELADILPSTKHDVDVMLSALTNYIEQIEDEPIRRFLMAIFADADLVTKFKRAPAAMKIHHAFVGGLLEHTLSMVRVAWSLCNQRHSSYQRLNRSVLVAGVILHDLGKVDELSVGVAFGYTKAGTLVGHIPMGFSLIERVATETGLDAERKLQLQHLLLSHHGEPEYGTVKRPMTPEAIALHLIDKLDASLEAAWRLIDAAPAGDEFTAYVPSIERCLYTVRHTPHDDDGGVNPSSQPAGETDSAAADRNDVKSPAPPPAGLEVASA
jgi:3'-5' exoribonuclease